MIAYADYYDLDEEETEEFLYIIQRLDNHILNKALNEHKARMTASRTTVRRR